MPSKCLLFVGGVRVCKDKNNSGHNRVLCQNREYQHSSLCLHIVVSYGQTDEPRARLHARQDFAVSGGEEEGRTLLRLEHLPPCLLYPMLHIRNLEEN